MVRPAVALVLLAACTANPPRVEEEAAKPTADAPLFRSIVGPQLAQLHAIDDQRALVILEDEEARTASLSLIGPEGPAAWSFALPTPTPKYGWDPAPQVSGDLVTVPWLHDKEFHGEIGLDLATGAERWRTIVPVHEMAALTDGREHYRSVSDATQRLEIVGGTDRLGVVAIDPATGARQWISTMATGGYLTIRHVLAPNHLIVATGRADPDDPDNKDPLWHVMRRGDGRIGPIVDGGEAACVVDERFYVQRGDAIAVVDLREPTPTARELLRLVEMPGLIGPGRLVSCHAYAGLPVLITEHEYRATQLTGLDAAGAVAWQLSLGERRIERQILVRGANEPLPAVLPPILATITSSATAGSIVLVDLEGRRVVREMIQNYEQWYDAYLFAVDGRYLLSMGPGDSRLAELDEARRFTRLLTSIDSRTGELGGAATVLGPRHPLPEHVAGGRVWLAASELAADGGVTRTRLDAATLAGEGAAPAVFTVADGAAEVARGLRLGDPRRPWGARTDAVDTRVTPAVPALQPADRRIGPGPRAPAWDTAPIEAAAAERCGAPASRRADLMAWLISEDHRPLHLEYALVGLEYDDPTRGHVWCLALTVRSGPEDPWRVYHGSSHSPARRRILRRRPSNADVHEFLEHSDAWSYVGEEGDRIFDGDIMDDAWRAVTGAAPTRFLRVQR